MIRYLTLDEVLDLHQWGLQAFGGLDGIRDRGLLESAVHQPSASFSGQELYPTLAEKASAIGYSLVMNHPFIDGNKRAGFASMATFLIENGCVLTCESDEVLETILAVAAGEMDRPTFALWVSGCAIYPPVE